MALWALCGALLHMCLGALLQMVALWALAGKIRALFEEKGLANLEVLVGP
jgi:protein-S-isoprenylcysteine O-methyltransferase Ste14